MTSEVAGEVTVETISFKWRINIDSFEGKRKGDSLCPTKNTDKLNNWLLKLYPEGSCKTTTNNNLSLYLLYLGEKEVIASFSFSILNQENGTVEHFKISQNHLFKKKTNWGFSYFLEKRFIMDPKNKIIKNNELTLVCKIITKECNIDKLNKSQRLESSSPSSEDSERFEKLSTNKEFSDVVVTAEEKSFYLHKCLLAASSETFKGMFKNKENNTQSTVLIDDVKYVILQELFRFIYTGKVLGIEAIASDLLVASEKYSVKDLKVLCEETMCENITADNAIEYTMVAIKNGAEKLKTYAINWMSLNFEDLLQKPELDQLGKQHPEVLLKIIREQSNECT